MTAIREANQIGTLQPTTLVAYDADIAPIFDATDAAALAALGVSGADLSSDDWRARMQQEGKAPTQRLAEQLKHLGYAGLHVRSFAKGARAEDRNIVLWTWGPELPTRLLLVDDAHRLG